MNSDSRGVRQIERRLPGPAGPSLGCVAILLLALVCPAGLQAQGQLAGLLPALIGEGIDLEEGFHQAHFANESSEAVARALNASLLTQLASSPPVSSTAGGFTWEYDPDLMTYTQTTETFGPIYAERPETIGKDKWNFGFSFFRFEYDSLDGISLDNGQFRFGLTHDDDEGDGPTNPFFAGDLVDARLFLDLTTESTVFFGTWGMTDRIDLSFAVPFVSVDLDARLDAQVLELSTEDLSSGGPVHRFAGNSTRASVAAGGSESGVGDVILRGKYKFENKAAAAVLELRLPTGDEENLLGSGGTQVKLSYVTAKRMGPITSHLNVGYTVSSGGGRGIVGELPNEFSLTAGFESALGKSVSLAVDLISRTLFDAARIEPGERQHFYRVCPAAGCSSSRGQPTPPLDEWDIASTSRPTIEVVSHDLNLAYLSAGLKVKLSEHLLLTGNLLLSMSSNGLQDEDPIPLVGLDWSF